MLKLKHGVKLAIAATTFLSISASAMENGAFLLKLQGGYSTTDSSIKSNTGIVPGSLDSTIKNNGLNGYNGGISFGYVASENVWTDITFSLDSLKTKLQSSNPTIQKVKTDNVSAMLNGYYGLNMSNRFSPYVMLGLGVGVAKTTLTIPQDGMVINGIQITVTENGQKVPLKGLKSKNTNYFAYQGGFGLAFELMQSISLDVGYRIGNQQVANFKDIQLADTTKLNLQSKNRLKQSVLFGVNILF